MTLVNKTTSRKDHRAFITSFLTSSNGIICSSKEQAEAVAKEFTGPIAYCTESTRKETRGAVTYYYETTYSFFIIDR